MQIVSATPMRERGRDGQFWKRFALGSAVGYVYAVFGLALTFAVLGVVGSMIRYPPDGVFSGVAAFVLTVPHILVMSFIVGIFMGLAMFALALWKFCLRHYNASGEKPGPGRFGGWWRGRSLVTKLAMAAGAVVFIALFGL